MWRFQLFIYYLKVLKPELGFFKPKMLNISVIIFEVLRICQLPCIKRKNFYWKMRWNFMILLPLLLLRILMVVPNNFEEVEFWRCYCTILLSLLEDFWWFSFILVTDFIWVQFLSVFLYAFFSKLSWKTITVDVLSKALWNVSIFQRERVTKKFGIWICFFCEIWFHLVKNILVCMYDGCQKLIIRQWSNVKKLRQERYQLM